MHGVASLINLLILNKQRWSDFSAIAVGLRGAWRELNKPIHKTIYKIDGVEDKECLQILVFQDYY